MMDYRSVKGNMLLKTEGFIYWGSYVTPIIVAESDRIILKAPAIHQQRMCYLAVIEMVE
jgi:hypothetical protein